MTTEGQRVKLIRKELNFSQQELAKIFNVNPSFISSVETNNKFLSREKLNYLLVNYNVNINYLLAGIGEPFLNKSDKKPIPDDSELYEKFKQFMSQEGMI